MLDHDDPVRTRRPGPLPMLATRLGSARGRSGGDEVGLRMERKEEGWTGLLVEVEIVCQKR